ncbi:IclR family transcriptional regulator [Virgibacillus sediminis]|uniref:IclR family transcriptional regulator n=1 Tax=Virgibacillus sediminis TaxID=202260 RepID=A0ABV7A8E0_9BACI
MSKIDSMQTIDRAMLILQSFSTDVKELSLAELHRRLGVSKSSLQRILNSLVGYGILEKDEVKKTYKLGIGLYFLGQLVEKDSQLLTISKRYMEQLRDKLSEAVSLNIISQSERKCIGYVEGKHELTTISYVGQTSPLYAGASAKLLLAYLPLEERNRLLDQIEFNPISKRTILDTEKLRGELEKIIQDGYSISEEERVEGAIAISAPICNPFNEVIAAITISAPTVRLNREKVDYYITHLKETAATISLNLTNVENQ